MDITNGKCDFSNCCGCGNNSKRTSADCKEKEKKMADLLVTLQDTKAQYPLPLIYREDINHDTRLYRFGLPSKEHILGLPVGQHVHFTAEIDGEVEVRKYTPVSNDDVKGHVDFVIKVYFKNVHPKFPEGGKMSQYVDNMKIGETMNFRGPTGRLIYKQPGVVTIRPVKKDPSTEYTVNVKKVAMIAGGSGIAPMLQLVRQITQDPEDSTEMTLLFANQSENDILLRKELDECAAQYPEQFQVWYTVDKKSSEDWKYSVGYVTEEMIKERLFPPSPDTLVVMCGPKPMMEFACKPNLDALGYDSKLVFKY